MFQVKKAVSPSRVRSRTHTDTGLTNILISNFQDDDAFVADKVFPMVKVKNFTDFYYSIPSSDFNRSQMQERARGAAPTLGQFDYEKTAFLAKIFALMVAQTDEDEYDMDDILEWDTDAVMFLNFQGKLRREIDFFTTYFKAGVWTRDLTGIAAGTAPSDVQFTQWSDDASDPIKDIRRERTRCILLTGVKLNTLTMDEYTKDVLLEHPGILDRLDRGQTPGGPAKASIEDLKRLFEVEYIHVSYAVQNTAARTTDEENAVANEFITANGCLFSYTPPRVGKRVPAAGYNFVVDIYSDIGMRMRRHDDRLRLADFHIIDDAQAYHQVSADLGVFFENTGTL